MKKASLLSFLLMVTCLMAWSQNTKSVTTPAAPAAVATKSVTFKGEFRSYRGVMQTLSCHCFDGGVLTTSAGKEIKVCFEKGELEDYQRANEKMECNRIQVTGKMVSHTIAPSNQDVCSPGTITYLKVKSFKCLN
ncbi:MAG: hypothetical protein KA293_11055 [Bacteroidia bacterium]|nr:hypothetical protein [Bacteroidia bacterium]